MTDIKCQKRPTTGKQTGTRTDIATSKNDVMPEQYGDSTIFLVIIDDTGCRHYVFNEEKTFRKSFEGSKDTESEL